MNDGGFIAEIAAVFLGSGEIPCLSITWPRNVIRGWKNWHLLPFNVIPAILELPEVLSHVPLGYSKKPMSSMWHSKPERSERTSFI